MNDKYDIFTFTEIDDEMAHIIQNEIVCQIQDWNLMMVNGRIDPREKFKKQLLFECKKRFFISSFQMIASKSTSLIRPTKVQELTTDQFLDKIIEMKKKIGTW